MYCFKYSLPFTTKMGIFAPVWQKGSLVRNDPFVIKIGSASSPEGKKFWAFFPFPVS